MHINVSNKINNIYDQRKSNIKKKCGNQKFNGKISLTFH